MIAFQLRDYVRKYRKQRQLYEIDHLKSDSIVLTFGSEIVLLYYVSDHLFGIFGIEQTTWCIWCGLKYTVNILPMNNGIG